MITITNQAECCGCSACVQICPKHCIRMQEDSEGFLYPEVDTTVCIGCGRCEQVCPIVNRREEVPGTLLAYAAYSKDEQIRAESSSGGIFTELARQVLACGGAVTGAAFSEGSVRHITVEREEDLSQLRGSKYLQSDMDGIYQDTRQRLRQGQEVLFSGTPCEIEGLQCFLGREYANLLCVDFICHGTPSPKLFRKYLSEFEIAIAASVDAVRFRDKVSGWKRCSLSFLGEGRRLYSSHFQDDPYMQMFLQNLCLRPSCYDCKFKKLHRTSDITLADFWGGDRLVPEMDDDQGLSLVIVHSPRGQVLFDQIGNSVSCKPVNLEEALHGNPSMRESCRKPEQRDAFMEHLDEMSVAELQKAYVREVKISLPGRIRMQIVNILQRMGLLRCARNIRDRIRRILK